MRRVLAGLLPTGLVGLLVVTGCGRKLPPEPPLLLLPARVDPLRVAQQGSDVVLRFPYPSRTSQGEELTQLTRVTIYREVIGAPAGARPPAIPEDGAAREREERQFLQRAERLAELTRDDLDALTSGSEIVYRDSLYPLYNQKRLGRVILRYAVTATRDRDRTSDLSPLVPLLPRVPPDAPVGLFATVEERRVCLDFLPPAAMLDGGKPVVVGAYAVYRRDDGEPEYDRPLGVQRNGPFFIDETTRTGQRYRYTVRAAPEIKPGQETDDLVLGPPANEVLVDTRDVFAPPPPESLLVLPEETGNRLVWNPVLVPDLEGYRVYRLLADGRWERFNQKITEATFVDKGAPRRTRYAVTAIDRSGNESPRSEMTEDRK